MKVSSSVARFVLSKHEKDIIICLSPENYVTSLHHVIGIKEVDDILIQTKREDKIKILLRSLYSNIEGFNDFLELLKKYNTIIYEDISASIKVSNVFRSENCT